MIARNAPLIAKSMMELIFLFMISAVSESISMEIPLDLSSSFRRSISARVLLESSITLTVGDLERTQETTSFPLVLE